MSEMEADPDSFESVEDDFPIEIANEDVEKDPSTERTIRRSSLFNIYAKVFRYMLSKWIGNAETLKEEQFDKELEDLILPSNEEWRHSVYYRLVELQRVIDGDSEKTRMLTGSKRDADFLSQKSEVVKQAWEWEPTRRAFPLKPRKKKEPESVVSFAAVLSAGGSMTEACVQPGWRNEDIVLAARVLQKKKPEPAYADEAEMRRVFGLVYDVLRYKEILNRALLNVDFWITHKEFKDREKLVWLLLYDMQGRKFSRIGNNLEIAERQSIFDTAGLLDIEYALLETKTKLAASVSRLRIKGSALTLGIDHYLSHAFNNSTDELLPAHLRSAEGISWGNDCAIASGWINTTKISSKAEFVREMSKLGLYLCSNCACEDLEHDQYVFDPLCPKVINIHEKAREKLAMSKLVRDFRFIFLERSLCLGAASLALAIRKGNLCGPVILTHSVAPRHTGYLSGLLSDIEDAGRLLAFGAGDQRSEYETYLHSLGVTLQRCKVFSERYTDAPAFSEVDRATIVLATPPCSYTGVRDVVDLAVARGGDTELLETLTKVDNDLSRTRALLSEQLSTLRYALTRPNVQLLIYEAHTVLPTETTEMVYQAMRYANNIAAAKFARAHPNKRRYPKDGSKSSRLSKAGKRSRESRNHFIDDIRSTIDDDEEVVPDSFVNIPDSDVFESLGLDELFGERCERFLNQGAFVVMIKRKEIMQFNSLFMIRVAGSKGLFGDPNKQSRSKEERSMPPIVRQPYIPRKIYKRHKVMNVERISAPTYSSISRGGTGTMTCLRHRQHLIKNQMTLSSQGSVHETKWLSVRDQNKSMRRLSKPIYRQVPEVPLDEEYDDIGTTISLIKEFGQSFETINPTISKSTSHEHLQNQVASTWTEEESFSKFLRSMFSETPRRSLLTPRDMENKDSKKLRFRSKLPTLYHPGRRLSILPYRTRLETVVEHETRGFPYLFPGATPSAMDSGNVDL